MKVIIENDDRFDNSQVYELDDSDGIVCKSLPENCRLATEKEILMDNIRTTLNRLLLSKSVPKDIKDFVLEDQDLYPIIQKDWETHERLFSQREKDVKLVIENGKIFTQEYL